MSDVVLLDNPVLTYRANSSVPVNIAAVAKRIATHLGGDMLEAARGEVYYVPFAAVHSDLAADKGVAGLGTLYGGVVREYQHADKAILHALPSASSAAEIRAIEALAANPEVTAATTRLKYDYTKSAMRTPGQELFVGHSRMDILVELVGVC